MDAVEAALKGEVLVPAGQAGGDHRPVAAARARRRRARDGPQARPARAARPGRPAARPRPGPGHLPGRAPRARSCPRSPGGRTRRSAPTSASRTPPPTRPTRRWTGCKARQDAIEKKLARRHLAPEANPSRMALFDLSSSWLEGSHCPLGARGYSRDGKKGNVQIEYGLLTDPAGPPGRGPGPRGEHRRPRRLHRDRRRRQGHLRAAEDGHGRRPRHDHHRPHRGPEGTRRQATRGSPRCAPPPSAS